MQDRDFETLAGSIPFPASDIAADYSPVEKEHIQGPITRSLVVPSMKAPIGAKVPIVDQNGRQLISKRDYTRQVIIPGRTDLATAQIDNVVMPVFGYGTLWFMLTAITHTADLPTWRMLGIDQDGGIGYEGIAQGPDATHPTWSPAINWADEIYQAAAFPKYSVRIEFTANITSVTWYAVLYYR